MLCALFGPCRKLSEKLYTCTSDIEAVAVAMNRHQWEPTRHQRSGEDITEVFLLVVSLQLVAADMRSVERAVETFPGLLLTSL